MTDKLSVYNLTMVHLGERKTTLSENREPKRVLDDIWDHTVQLCLEAAQWNFLKRVVQLDASTSVVPSFGWTYAFLIPSDSLRIEMVSLAETFIPPLLDFDYEAGYLYANSTPLFVKVQSKDAAYGLDLSTWTASFTQYVSLQLAETAVPRIPGKAELLAGPTGISARLKKAQTKAASLDAMNQGPKEMPTGTWARSRRGFQRGVPLPGGTSFDD